MSNLMTTNFSYSVNGFRQINFAASPSVAPTVPSLTGTPATYFTTSSTATWGGSYTVPSATDQVLFANILYYYGTSVSTVTYGATSMTLYYQDTSGIGISYALYYIINPTAGSNTVTVTLTTNPGAGIAKSVGIFTLQGVNQTTPVNNLGSTSGTGSSASLSVDPTTNYSLLLSAVSDFGFSGTVVNTTAGGQSELWNYHLSATNITESFSSKSADIVLEINVSDSLIVGQGQNDWASTLNSWTARKKVTITGQSGGSTNMQVLLKVGQSSGSSGYDFHLGGNSSSFPTAKDTAGDFRFTDTAGTLLDFWIEEVTGSGTTKLAYAWVEVSADLSSNQDIYIYYHNAGASNASSGANTFIFFDDFPGSSLDTTTKWQTSIGTASSAVSVTGSNLVQFDQGVPGNYTQVASKTASYDVGTSIRFRTERTLGDAFGNFQGGYSSSLGNASGDVYVEARNFETKVAHNHTGATGNTIHVGVISQNVFYRAEIRRISSSKSVANWVNDDFSAYATVNDTITTGSFSGAAYVASRSADGVAMKTDWIFVRKTVDTDPAFNTAGVEEGNVSTAITVTEFNNINTVQNITITESITRSGTLFRSVNDTLTTTESVTVDRLSAAPFNLSVTDTLTTTENRTQNSTLASMSQTQNVTITESVTVSTPFASFAPNIPQAMTITESVTVTNATGSTSVFGTITLTESITMLIPVLFVSVFETLTMTDGFLNNTMSVTISEFIGITEFVDWESFIFHQQRSNRTPVGKSNSGSGFTGSSQEFF